MKLMMDSSGCGGGKACPVDTSDGNMNNNIVLRFSLSPFSGKGTVDGFVVKYDKSMLKWRSNL